MSFFAMKISWRVYSSWSRYKHVIGWLDFAGVVRQAILPRFMKDMFTHLKLCHYALLSWFSSSYTRVTCSRIPRLSSRTSGVSWGSGFVFIRRTGKGMSFWMRIARVLLTCLTRHDLRFDVLGIYEFDCGEVRIVSRRGTGVIPKYLYLEILIWNLCVGRCTQSVEFLPSSWFSCYLAVGNLNAYYAHALALHNSIIFLTNLFWYMPIRKCYTARTLIYFHRQL